MKRLLYCSAFAITIGFMTSCAQHDPNSPDTSGAVPYDKPGVGVDTTTTTTGSGTTTPNMSNDHSNKDQGINDDTSVNKQ